MATQSDAWQDLYSQEKEMTEDYKCDIKKVNNMVNSDRLEEQNKKLRNDLNLSSNEDPEVDSGILKKYILFFQMNKKD
jgi:hypothetical protein